MTQSDYGLMVFADIRYQRHDKRDKLPQWITSQLRDAHLNLSTDMLLAVARQFMRGMGQARCRTRALNITYSFGTSPDLSTDMLLAITRQLMRGMGQAHFLPAHSPAHWHRRFRPGAQPTQLLRLCLADRREFASAKCPKRRSALDVAAATKTQADFAFLPVRAAVRQDADRQVTADGGASQLHGHAAAAWRWPRGRANGAVTSEVG